MHEPHWCRQCEAVIPDSALTHGADDQQHPVHPGTEIPGRRQVDVTIVATDRWSEIPAGGQRLTWVPAGTYLVALDEDGERLAHLQILSPPPGAGLLPLAAALAHALRETYAHKEHTHV